MKVKDCMCQDVCSCTPETTIENCAKLMSEKHVGCVPVCNTNQEIVGLVTDRDLILRCIACDKDAKQTPVSDVMTTNICSCTPNDEIEDAENKMAKLQIRRIPVIDNKKVIGIITVGDLTKNNKVSNQSVCNTLESICKTDRNNAQ